MNTPTICTIIAKNYLAQARCLADSLHAFHPEAQMFVLLVDRINDYFDPSTEDFTLVAIDQLSIPDLPAMIARYTSRELATAVKPYFLEYLFTTYHLDRICYFDPDIYLYAPLTSLWQKLSHHSAILTPHLLGPLDEGHRPNEYSILQAGTFNLGFLAVRHTPAARRFLQWWQQRLVRGSHGDPKKWQHFDQKWIDLLPGFVDNVLISRDPGYNVAYWDLANRHLTYTEKGYRVNGEPLTFFHFSGYDPALPNELSRHQNRFSLLALPVVKALCDDYRRQLYVHGYAKTSQWPYELPETSTNVPATARQATWQRLRIRVTEYHRSLRSNMYRLLTGKLATWGLEEFLVHVLGQRLIARIRSLFIPLATPVFRQRPRSLGVNVMGYFHHNDGVGEAARQSVAALLHHNYPVARWPVTVPVTSPGLATPPKWHYPLSLIHVNADTLASVATAQPAFFENSFRTIGWWWWELSTFPARWHDRFRYLDELWVGSTFVKEALTPVTSLPIQVMGVPISTGSPPKLSRSFFGLPERSFIFLFVMDFASFMERKNPLGIVEAYRKAFGRANPDTLLVIKARNAEKFPRQAAQLRDALDHVGGYFLTETFTRPQLRALFAVADAYVSLHRSEGFGLTIAEAMSQGKPTIATNYSGNTDFMNERNSFPVRYTLTEVGATIGPYDAASVWAEPDIEQAAYFMRQVVADRQQARQKGAIAAREMHVQYSQQAIGQKMVDRLQQLRATIRSRSKASN